jgi:hypothetical protein
MPIFSLLVARGVRLRVSAKGYVVYPIALPAPKSYCEDWRLSKHTPRRGMTTSPKAAIQANQELRKRP